MRATAGAGGGAGAAGPAGGGRGGGAGAAGGRRGELAGLPQQDDLLQPAEEAGEAGHDEGAQGPDPRLVRFGGVAQGGELLGQGGLG
ncbi:MAG: hypothetical protein IT555_21130 [Acetobacteraceae bacterium]|nr:hypothetical protein [Acetobacteraceae bacterium]